MPLNRGLHHITAADVERVIDELRHDGRETFVLPNSIRNKRSFIEAVRSVLPLDPPLIGYDNWDALSDSIWGGIDSLVGRRIGVVWLAAAAMAETDPEAYGVAIEILGNLTTSLADPEMTAGETKDVVVVVVSR